MNTNRIAILGDGGWGTALALVLARKGISPTLWGAFPEYVEEMKKCRENKKFLPSFMLPETIRLSSDLIATVQSSDVLVFVVPTKYMRGVFEKMKSYVRKGTIIVSCTKGIETDTFKMPSEVMKEYMPDVTSAVLSGPSHAEEVARAVPTCTVVAAEEDIVAKKIQQIFMEERFRVYTSQDLRGVEIGGALKNVIAIAAGICDGLGFGANTKAALLARGLQEIIRLGAAMGAQQETFFGLTGMGDLVTTCFSPFGRNRAVGERIGRGEKLKNILDSMEIVAEGVLTTQSAFQLGERYGIELPIVREVFAVLYQDKDPLRSISELMMRGSKDEIDS